MKRIALFVAVGLMSLLGLSSIALAGDPISPLYQARLDATLAEWETAATVAVGDGEIGPDGWPVSAHPASFCLASLCVGSYCLGSGCLNSDCLGSGCLHSGCLGSACAGSICVGSGCLGSMCGGSACLGPTLCIRSCEPDLPQDPEPPAPSFTWATCPER